MVNYPYPMPAATGICNAKYSKMKRAFTGGSVEIDLTSSQALFKVCWHRAGLAAGGLPVARVQV